MELELKFAGAGAGPVTLAEGETGTVLSGHASLFGARDGGGDVVMPGAYAAGLKRLAARGGRVRMLWQHDPAQPIGVWDEVCEDARGLFVKGRLLTEVARGREAAALIAAGAMDGLSIGYRTLRASKRPEGGRCLEEVELWEVSLVTFPMLTGARVGGGGIAGKAAAPLDDLARALGAGRAALARRRADLRGEVQ
ncbi:HK97 family phage prohead protease [Pseudoroseicyclus aestuarii]|uniref:Prohead serine protease domain-containing protein n=1 Tax=Pseudoroseicyclus aestuarii TaxID=1795041 RepID=A0A318SVT4_9RHOB|nr:HK97 family phage prohead protease [Pseudoroseicyclus aestuarii]PYE85713.1 hypothetical protein DFP88_101383 [Pseudoroseicyclus aestuarii]